MELSLDLLGPPRIRLDGAPLTLPRRRARALLYYLAAEGAPQSRDHLIALLWPELDESRARHALRSTLYQLRRSGLPIEADRETVRFRPATRLRVDLHRFQEATDLIHAPDAPPGPMTLAHLTELANLYRGDFLEGFYLDSVGYEDWLYLERERWRSLYLDLLDRLIEAQIEAGHYLQALDRARQALATDALQERFHRVVMQLLAWLGQRTEALAQYERCVQLLREKLGTAPLEETEALHRAILADAVTPPAQARRAVGSRWPAPGHRAPFVGQRSGQWILSEVLARAVSDPTPVVMITGDAGVGKSRLVQEVLTAAPVLTIWGTARRSLLPRPYDLFIEAFRADLAAHGPPEGMEAALLDALAPLLPELGRPRPSKPTPPDLLWEALAAWPIARARRGPVALVLDDIHRTDPDSWSALPTLLDRWSAAPIALISTVQTTQVPLTGADLARSLARSGRMLVVPLGGLLPGDVAELLAWLGGGHSAPVRRFADRLHTATGGNPLFLLEMLRTLTEPRTALRPTDWRRLMTRPVPALPADLETVVLQRLHRRGAEAIRLAEWLAVAADPPPPRAMLARLGPFTEAALDGALQALLTAGLIRVQGAGYAFTHEALQEVVYRAQPLEARRRRHHRTAEALAQGESGVWSGAIAAHYRAAGDAVAAGRWAARAAEEAERLGAPLTARKALRLAEGSQGRLPSTR